MREGAAENWAQETAGWRGQDRAGQRALWPFTTEDRKFPRTPTICLLLLPRGLGEVGGMGARGAGEGDDPWLSAGPPWRGPTRPG